MAKFASKKEVDPQDQDEFTRPVLLHRRDPKQGPPGKEKEEVVEDVPMDSKEREKQEILKAKGEAKSCRSCADCPNR
jgi:transcription initiation factor TFIIF subunit alpha